MKNPTPEKVAQQAWDLSRQIQKLRTWSSDPVIQREELAREAAAEREVDALIASLGIDPANPLTRSWYGMGPAEGAITLWSLLRKACREQGMMPVWEVFCHSPGMSSDHFPEGGRYWRVCWESGPHDWAVEASLGRTRMSRTTSFGPVVGGDWYTEPYYGFDLFFIPSP